MLSTSNHNLPRGEGYSAEVRSGELSPELLSQVNLVRSEAWKKHGIDRSPNQLHSYIDQLIDKLDSTQHLIVSQKNTVVAATRITLYEDIHKLQNSQYYLKFTDQLLGPIAQVTRMAVHPEHQRKGLANYLFEKSIQQARLLNAACFTGSAFDHGHDLSFTNKHALKNLGETDSQGCPTGTKRIIFAKKL